MITEELRNKANSDDKVAQYEMGMEYWRDGNVKEAAQWFFKSANVEKDGVGGDADSMNWVGSLYEYGDLGQVNIPEAKKWYEKAAEGGSRDGQTSLGSFYYNGKGVNKDFKTAVYWLLKAADRPKNGDKDEGSSIAQNMLGNIYYDEGFSDRSINESLKWHERAANNKGKNGTRDIDPDYQVACAMAYLCAFGELKDLSLKHYTDKAKYYLTEALNSGRLKGAKLEMAKQALANNWN